MCDVYDALRTHRPYRDAWESNEVLKYLQDRAGVEFEPGITGEFLRMMTHLEGRVHRRPNS